VDAERRPENCHSTIDRKWHTFLVAANPARAASSTEIITTSTFRKRIFGVFDIECAYMKVVACLSMKNDGITPWNGSPGRTNMRWARRMRICLFKTVKAPCRPDAGGTARSCAPLKSRAIDVGCDHGGKTQVITISFQE